MALEKAWAEEERSPVHASGGIPAAGGEYVFTWNCSVQPLLVSEGGMGKATKAFATCIPFTLY